MPQEPEKNLRDEFDDHLYLLINPDVAAKQLDPWEHYVRHGKAEGRPFPARYDTSIIAKYTKYISSGYFDPEWYLATYPDVRDSGKNPLQHFCENGVWEGRDPSAYFSTSWYLEQYVDVRDCNPLEHFIDYGIKEGRLPAPPRGALSAAERTFNSICDLEPDLYTEDKLYFFMGVSFVDGRKKNSKIKSILNRILKRIPQECERLIFVPWLIHSGADTVLANIVHKTLELHDPSNLAVVVADYGNVQGRDWLPEKTNIITLSEFDPKLTTDERSELIEKMLLVVRPKRVLNVNSRACWNLFRDRGHILTRYSELFACLFCRDYNDRGVQSGYADTHFRDSLHHMKAIYLDNAGFRDELVSQYALLAPDVQKIKILRQPVKGSYYLQINRHHTPALTNNIDILWAARISRQKNYALLSEIISLAPKTYKFHIWGGGDADDIKKLENLLADTPNAKLYGPYSSFGSLPLHAYDVYLYTSLWDGIPNTLLEAASFGLPVIASNVGGVSEVVSDEKGWLVDPPEKAIPYIAALEDVAGDRDKAKTKAAALAAFLAAEHSWDKFGTALRAPGQFLGEA